MGSDDDYEDDELDPPSPARSGPRAEACSQSDARHRTVLENLMQETALRAKSVMHDTNLCSKSDARPRNLIDGNFIPVRIVVRRNQMVGEGRY